MSCVRNLILAGVLSLLCIANVAYTQDTTSVVEYIGVTARPYKDSILLRWAPTNFEVWRTGNLNGYTIERYLMTRNGEMANPVEKVVLNDVPIKALPEESWDGLVQRDRFCAIAAQALYGDHFEIDLANADVFSIVNKVRENEQRYTFALFSADMSVTTAKASGLWFTDKSIKQGEKYLYRVLIHNRSDTIRGSVFTGPDDAYHLSQPRNLLADFQDQTVSLRWDRDLTFRYTAYIVERSTGGSSFQPISDVPLITLSNTETEATRYEYATDSIGNLSATYFYRVKGVTPFGETGIASDTVSGKSTAIIKTVPYIFSGDNINNSSIHLRWDFPMENNTVIKGFNVERSPSPRGSYHTLASFLNPTSRAYEDKTPEQVNYYRVTAVDLQGAQYHSPVYLAQLIDSIPPSPPVGLEASVDEFGNVALTWNANKEFDMYGYRVYKSNTNIEEMAQVTIAPQRDTIFSDRADLNTLNESVYYTIMAIDRNQNHSKLSELLKVALPDKVKPQPPVFLPVEATTAGVTLRWSKSSSTDVVQYDVYRRPIVHSSQWQRLKVISASDDTLYVFIDNTARPGERNYYTITAVDEVGLESDPATPISAGKISSILAEPVTWKEPSIDRVRNELTLSWKSETPGVTAYRIYRIIDDRPMMLHRTLQNDAENFTEKLIPGKTYKYRMLALFEGGYKSQLSEEIVIQY